MKEMLPSLAVFQQSNGVAFINKILPTHNIPT